MNTIGTIQRHAIAAAALVALITSNVVCQKNPQQPVQIPDKFRGSEAVAAGARSIGDLKWFEVFQDDQLQNLLRTALAQNYDLQTAIARIESARASLGITRSNQFPQVSGSADYTNTRFSGSEFPFGGGGFTTKFKEILGNLLTFELDVWGRLRNQTKAARAQLRASEEDRRTVMTTVISDVATAYFSLLELDLELSIAEDTLASRRESLKLIRLREEGGVATMLDVSQAEQLVYQASQTIPDVKRQIEETENQLSLLLGRNPGPIPRGKRLDEQAELPTVPPGLPSSLLERRPDIRSAEQNLLASKFLISAAKAAYFPQITLTGDFGFQSRSLSNLFTGPAKVWSYVVPEITQPIFTGGFLKSQVNLQRAQRDLALVQYQQTIKTAFSDVSNALVEYRRVREIREQQELLVASLRVYSRLAYMRYEGGVDTLLNALIADTNLFDAQLSVAQTKRDELLSLVQLYKALGGGWQL